MLAIPTPTPVLISTVPSTVIESGGSVSLASTRIMVQSGGTALVPLDCLGIASCNGKLALTAKSTGKPKGKRKSKKTITVTIGSASFSISGDEAKMVKIKLDSTGRKLLGKEHRRLVANLTILELAPSSQDAHVTTVQLLQETADGKAER